MRFTWNQSDDRHNEASQALVLVVVSGLLIGLIVSAFVAVVVASTSVVVTSDGSSGLSSSSSLQFSSVLVWATSGECVPLQTPTKHQLIDNETVKVKFWVALIKDTFAVGSMN